jgi:hypothetical protein
VQFRRLERLGDEIIASRLDARQSIAAVGFRGHDDDWNQPRRGLRFERATEVRAMAARRDEIDEHEVGRIRDARVHDGITAGDHEHAMPFGRERAMRHTSSARSSIDTSGNVLATW